MLLFITGRRTRQRTKLQTPQISTRGEIRSSARQAQKPRWAIRSRQSRVKDQGQEAQEGQ